MRHLPALALRLALLAALAAGSAAASSGLSELESAGEQIYKQGQSPSGARIGARLGIGGLELSGRSIACVNCHGDDGRGKTEGGIVPANIRWSELTKPYGHDHEGRRHGPFTEQHLRRAVVEGFDPAGNPLDHAMPRFAMSAKDLAALSAYLKRLEHLLDPGLDSNTIRIGTLLPMSGRQADLGQTLYALLNAHFELINARGGIHGRQLQLVVEPLPADAQQARQSAAKLLDKGDVFALLAPASAGIESELAQAAVQARTPVLGPLTLEPESTLASNTYVFHLLPGTAELAQLLAQHAAQKLHLNEQPIALWHADTPAGKAAAQALDAALRRAGWRDMLALPFLQPGAGHDDMAAMLKSRRVGALLVLGPGADLLALAQASERIGWAPQLLVPGPLAPRAIASLPQAFRDRVTLAYPTSPADQRADALREVAALLPGRSDTRAHRPAQVAAYAAAQLMAEALKRSGRDLSRSKLLQTLEQMSSFDTGVVPLLSYNADRRIGAMGGYLFAMDLERQSLRPLGGFTRLP